MPSLQFKGKSVVWNHHLAVPYHELIPKKEKSLNKTLSLHDNLIVHGDNLLALKALLPTYAGKVKCIYIDPPYNTGNEEWAYNDKANAPMLKEWLGKVVDREDLTRHDKWLCMMTPRLRLLRELLREDGVIFISIDDNEQHRLRQLMDEIFGENNCVTNYIWEARAGKDHTAVNVSLSHEYVVCFAKNMEYLDIKKDERVSAHGNYEDKKGSYRREQLRQWGTHDTRKDRPSMFYPITAPDGKSVLPIKDDGREGRWRISAPRLKKMIEDGDVDFVNISGRWQLYAKKRDGRITKTAYGTLLQGVGTASTGTLELKDIFVEKVFDTAKPTGLIKHLLNLITDKDSIILDSFAGSGTTAHAVLALNKEDGGNRKFILVECEDYADKITAERVRRVSKGVKNAKDENLRKGLGGTFSYFDLGKPIEMQSILEGKHLPSYLELARYVFYTATGEEFDERKMNEKKQYIGESKDYEVYLFYKPDVEYLKNTALTIDRARALGPFKKKKRLVFAPVKFLDEDMLQEYRIAFAQLPFEIYRLSA